MNYYNKLPQWLYGKSESGSGDWSVSGSGSVPGLVNWSGYRSRSESGFSSDSGSGFSSDSGSGFSSDSGSGFSSVSGSGSVTRSGYRSWFGSVSGKEGR